MSTSEYEQLVEKLKTHSSMKQYIHRNTMMQIAAIKKEMMSLAHNLTKDVTSIDKNVEIIFTDRGDFEAELKFSGDSLVFAMHTNTFTFSEDHVIHQLPYVQENPNRAYCGLIQIYNFLSDSIKYNRTHDYGYLIGRIFVNSENKFFIEGRENMGFNLLDYHQQELRAEVIQKIIADSMLYCIEFELETPPFEQSSIITLEEKQFNHTASGMNTGKRIGFEFSNSKERGAES
jgi:hypothetical protein